MMERIFEGYSPACQEAVVESRKHKDKLFYVFNKIVNGVVYALTDNKELKGNLLQTYCNGVIYEKIKEQVGEIQKLNVTPKVVENVILAKEESK